MSLGYELSQLINDASKLAGGTIDNSRIVLTASEIPNITTAKITDINNYATVSALGLKADESYVDNAVTDMATVTYVDNKVSTEIAVLTDNAPAILDTFKELADAMNNDATLATTLSSQIAGKADQNYVDAQFALKANTSTVNTQLDQKSDTSWVTSQLADKLEASDLGDYVTSATLTSNNTTLNASIDDNDLTFDCDINCSGELQATAFTATSDYRIKEDVVSISDTSFNIDNIRPIYYNNNKTQKPDFGVIAHETQEVFPFLVKGEKDGEELQSVNYTGFIGLLINEIQQLKKQHIDMSARFVELENKNTELETQISNITNK